MRTNFNVKKGEHMPMIDRVIWGLLAGGLVLSGGIAGLVIGKVFLS